MTNIDRNFKQENAEHLSQDTKNNILKFLETDKAFAVKFDAFLSAHPEEVLELDNLREKRNRELDDAEQGIRRDADLSPRDKVTSITFGPFSAQKKRSEWFIPETFVSIAERTGLYKALLDGGAIQIKTEVNREVANEFLRKNSAEKQFAAAKDAKELTTAISGPKVIPPFGAQLKKKA